MRINIKVGGSWDIGLWNVMCDINICINLIDIIEYFYIMYNR